MAAASNTKKSLPKPCIFRNSMRMTVSIADAAVFRSGVAQSSAKVLPYKENKKGAYAPRNGIECEGWMREEHAQHEHRRVLRPRRAQCLHCGLRPAALQSRLACHAARGSARRQRRRRLR